MTISAPTIEPMMPLGPEREAVAGEQADEEAAHERADETGDERHAPVESAGRASEQQLRQRSDRHPERDHSEYQHAVQATGPGDARR